MATTDKMNALSVYFRVSIIRSASVISLYLFLFFISFCFYN